MSKKAALAKLAYTYWNPTLKSYLEVGTTCCNLIQNQHPEKSDLDQTTQANNKQNWQSGTRTKHRSISLHLSPVIALSPTSYSKQHCQQVCCRTVPAMLSLGICGLVLRDATFERAQRDWCPVSAAWSFPGSHVHLYFSAQLPSENEGSDTKLLV